MSKPTQTELFGSTPENPSAPNISNRPGELTVYGASAGSGKTYTLTLEYLKYALSGEYNAGKFREILAVTFTNKATDEMKIRIVNTLNNIATDKDDTIAGLICNELNIDRDTLKNRAIRVQKAILHNWSNFSVSTIDKFFQKIVHSFVKEAGLRPGFRLELEQDRLIEEAVDRMMLNIHKEEFLYNHISNIIDEQIEKGYSWDIRKKLKEKGGEILKEQFHEFDRQFHEQIGDASFMYAFSGEMNRIIDVFERDLDKIADAAVSVIEGANVQKSDFRRGKYGIVNYFYKLLKGEYDLPKESLVDEILSNEDDDAWCKKNIPETVKNSIRNISGRLTDLLEKATNYHRENYRRYFTAVCIKKAMGHLGFFAEIEKNMYEAANDGNIMPIGETVHLLGKLISESDTPFIYEKTGARYGIFMIDEFQDTSEAQWQNFKPLLKNSLSEGRSSLVVGDVKQSIYRWRNGDWRILAYRIFSDFGNFAVREKNLDTNWRSFPEVVEFNNALFEALPACIEKNFVDNSAVPEVKITELSSAYRNVKQKIAKVNEDKGGYVSLSLIIDEEEIKAEDKILTQLPGLIADMQDRGYRARDIAILVRDAKDGQAVSDCLLNCAASDAGHCFDFVSADALLVKKSAAVKFIISLMKATINPDDSINNAAINYSLNRDNTDFRWAGSGVLDGSVTEKLSGLASLSLPEVFEQLLVSFNLGDDPVEIPYIMELHDILISFSTTEIPDISSFLEYWDDKSDKMHLPEGKAPDAITISTIHKAKGLEYPVVIIPFCDWSVKPRPTTTVWVSPAEEPFNRLRHVPVSYGNAMKNSYFEQEYYFETVQTLVDSLNLLYVAFTRAKEELHVMLPQSMSGRKNISLYGDVSLLLSDFLESNPEFLSGKLRKIQLTGDDLCYVSGNKQHRRENTEKDVSTGIFITNCISTGFDKKLRLKYESENCFTGQATSRLKNYGLLMHKVFSLIRSAKDVPAAIKSVEEEGLIEKEYVSELKTRVDKALLFAEQWFADGNTYEIITEKFLLLPASLNIGLSRRPDRIMLSENETIIVDYKFGAVKNDSHKRQVKNYVRLLEQMQYPNVKGYVWYVDMNSIEELTAN